MLFNYISVMNVCFLAVMSIRSSSSIFVAIASSCFAMFFSVVCGAFCSLL